MDLQSLRILLSSAGQDALQAVQALDPREEEYLSHFQTLCRRYPAGLAQAALETAILRGEAAAKFPFANHLYLTREALQQASSWEVARHRVGRFQGFEQVLDLGCSVGGDTLALADAAPVLGIDRDPLRLLMAQANARALGFQAAAHFLQADLNHRLPLKLSSKQAVFFDPARRKDGRRLYSVKAYQPPLARIKDWLLDIPNAAVKISPGVRLEELNEYDVEIEFVSLHGELKEALLWFGGLKTMARRATLLPGGQSLAEDAPDEPGQFQLDEPRAWLYEPDSAVLRAGVVQSLGRRLDAAQLDPDIAYLTANAYQPTPFARAWAVEDWFPFNLKRLRGYLRERGVGQVVVKKRGSPLQPQQLIRDLRLSGQAERVVFLTHLRGRPIVVVAYPQGEKS